MNIQYLNVLVTAAFLPRKAIFLSSLQRLSWRQWRKQRGSRCVSASATPSPSPPVSVGSDPSKPRSDFKERRSARKRTIPIAKPVFARTFECIYENQYRLAIIDCFHTLSEMYQERAANTKLEAVTVHERTRSCRRPHVQAPSSGTSGKRHYERDLRLSAGSF